MSDDDINTAPSSTNHEDGEDFYEPNPYTSVTSRWIGNPLTRFVRRYMPFVRCFLSPHSVQLVGCLCELLAAIYLHRRLNNIQEVMPGSHASHINVEAFSSLAHADHGDVAGAATRAVWHSILRARLYAVWTLGLLAVSTTCYIWAPVYAHMEGLQTCLDPYFDECVHLVHSFLTASLLGDILSLNFLINSNNGEKSAVLTKNLVSGMKCVVVLHSQLGGVHALLKDWSQRRHNAMVYARECLKRASRPRRNSSHPFYVFPPPPPARRYLTPSLAPLRHFFDTNAPLTVVCVMLALFSQLRKEREVLLGTDRPSGATVTPTHLFFSQTRVLGWEIPSVLASPSSAQVMSIVYAVLASGTAWYFFKVTFWCSEMDFVTTRVSVYAHRRHTPKGFWQRVLCMPRKRAWRVCLTLVFLVWAADAWHRLAMPSLWRCAMTIPFSPRTTSDGGRGDDPCAAMMLEGKSWPPEPVVAVGLAIALVHMDILWSSYRRDKVNVAEEQILSSAPPSPTTLEERKVNQRPMVLPPALPLFDTSRLPQLSPAVLLAAVILTLCCSTGLRIACLPPDVHPPHAEYNTTSSSSTLWPLFFAAPIHTVIAAAHEWWYAVLSFMTSDLFSVADFDAAARGLATGGNHSAPTSLSSPPEGWVRELLKVANTNPVGGDGHYWILLLFVGATLPIWLSVWQLYTLASCHRGVPVFLPVCNVLIDGLYDMCHIGHKRAMQVAISPWMAKYGGRYGLGGGNQLFCGVCGDEDSVGYKRLPMMTTVERMQEVESCGMAAVVIPNFPVDGRIERIMKFYHIHRMLCGEEYDDKKETDIYYVVPRRMGILDTTPRTNGISSSELIQRIQSRAP